MSRGLACLQLIEADEVQGLGGFDIHPRVLGVFPVTQVSFEVASAIVFDLIVVEVGTLLDAHALVGRLEGLQVEQREILRVVDTAVISTRVIHFVHIMRASAPENEECGDDHNGDHNQEADQASEISDFSRFDWKLF
ncbi:MAG: hypothetical protein AAF242_04760 [Bacteroidota bacterium]